MSANRAFVAIRKAIGNALVLLQVAVGQRRAMASQVRRRCTKHVPLTRQQPMLHRVRPGVAVTNAQGNVHALLERVEMAVREGKTLNLAPQPATLSRLPWRDRFNATSSASTAMTIPARNPPLYPACAVKPTSKVEDSISPKSRVLCTAVMSVPA